jgi:hypothetical protein
LTHDGNRPCETPDSLPVEGTPLTRVARAAAAAARAEARAERARQELYAAVRDAHRAGEAVALIAHAAGVTRQRVWQIVKEGESDD